MLGSPIQREQIRECCQDRFLVDLGKHFNVRCVYYQLAAIFNYRFAFIYTLAASP